VSATTQGRRVYPTVEAPVPLDGPGTYGQDADGVWWAQAPIAGASGARISRHSITVHEDGTITASPSILMNFGRRGVTWHGYLEHGVWREC